MRGPETMDGQEGLSTAGSGRRGVKAILVPTDFSDYSDMALAAAAEIAAQQKARIYLVHIAKMSQAAALEEKMRAQIAGLSRAAPVEIIPHIGEGVPAREILKLQAEKEADRIVIASRQGARVPRLSAFAGHLPDTVRKRAKCPVIVVGRTA